MISYSFIGGTNPSSNPTFYTIESPTITFANLTGITGYNATWNPASIQTGSIGDRIIDGSWTTNKYTVRYNANNGTGLSTTSSHTYGVSQRLTANTFYRKGYAFQGWATSSSGSAVHYDTENVSNLTSLNNVSVELYVVWSLLTYQITYTNLNGGTNPSSNPSTYTVLSPTITFAKPTRVGYRSGSWDPASIPSGSEGNITISATWVPIDYIIKFAYVDTSGSLLSSVSTMYITYSTPYEFKANEISGYTFKRWELNSQEYVYQFNPTIASGLTTTDGATVTFYAVYEKNPCVAEGTLITLADGRKVPVETLTGNEMLLVWNLFTGMFDIAPILFIDSDSATEYEIIHAYFSDGTDIKVIYEHAFWNINLNKYVFLRNDAAQYIGHWFNKQTTDANGNMTWTAVQLTNVVIANEVTSAWSPVTYEYLCYYVNGMLSMPGATTGLINIFEVDAETMQYDQEMMIADIEEFGLFTYEEFAEILSVPQEIFDAFDAQYLKVAIGKGLVDWETITELVERYAEFFAE